MGTLHSASNHCMGTLHGASNQYTTVQVTIVWVLYGAKVIVWVHFTMRSAARQVAPWILAVLEDVETGHLLLPCQPDWREDSTTVATIPHPAAADGNGTQTCGVPFSPPDPSQSCSAFECCVGRPQLGAQATVTGVPDKKNGVSTDSTLRPTQTN